MKLILYLFCTTTLIIIVNAHNIPFSNDNDGTSLNKENYYPVHQQQQRIDLPKVELPVAFNNNPFLKNSYGVPIIVNTPYREYGVPQISNLNNNNNNNEPLLLLGQYPDEHREDEDHQKIGIQTHYQFEIPHQSQENYPSVTQPITDEATTTQEPIRKPYEEYGVPHQITTTTPSPSSTLKIQTLPENQPPILILSPQPVPVVSVEQNNQQNLAIFQHQQQQPPLNIGHYSKNDDDDDDDDDDDCFKENKVTTNNFQYFNNRIPHQIISNNFALFAHPSAEQTLQFQHFQPIILNNNKPHVLYAGLPYFKRYYNTV